MDLVKSHISGWFFLHPCSPLYNSVFLQLSWGPPDSDREVYIRPGEDVTITEVSQDPAQRGHLTPEQVESPGAEPSKSTGIIGQPKSPSAFCHQRPSDLLSSLRPWTQLRRWLSWLWLWRWLASVRLFTSKAVWTKMTSCQARRRTWPTTCWGWWDNKPLANVNSLTND